MNLQLAEFREYVHHCSMIRISEIRHEFNVESLESFLVLGQTLKEAGKLETETNLCFN